MGKSCRVRHGRFVFQKDGNAVIYDGNDKALWHTNTVGGDNKLVFRKDGNLVVYSKSNFPLWNSKSFDKGGVSLVFQDDRSLVIYNKSKKIIWDSGTGEGDRQ